MQDPLSVMTQHIKRLEEEVRKWKNIAGIMHEAIQEGDCEGARIHYEENASAWLQ
jgi:hypothetical protein